MFVVYIIADGGYFRFVCHSFDPIHRFVVGNVGVDTATATGATFHAARNDGDYNQAPVLTPSLSSYKIIIYISIAYKQENTLQVLQLRCCVDFMNESDDCSSGAARSGVNFQMPVNRFLQSFRL